MIKWTPKAEKDLEQIIAHITKSFNPELAFNIVLSLVEFVETTLSFNPLAGMILESNPLFSKIIFEGNSIYYCENPRSKDIYVVYVRPRGSEVDSKRLNQNEVA